MIRLYITACIAALIALSCNTKDSYHQLKGETMGTYYSVTYLGQAEALPSEELEDILRFYNSSLSTYEKNSAISKFNRTKKGIALSRQDTFFEKVFLKSKEYHKSSDGHFDPTVMPLVNYWGFGYKEIITSNEKKTVDSLLQYIDLKSIELLHHKGFTYLRKQNPDVQLDFSSIAKGYAIDIIASFLEKKGIQHYLVDIGGEARAKGKNPKNTAWKMAINTPKENAKITDTELIIVLDNASIATSGNYRNVAIKNGRKVSHTINPKTGYPERSNLLSATIITEECIDADALATCVMVLGLEKAKSFLNLYPTVEACLIYDGDGDDKLERYYTSGFEKYIIK